MNDGEVSWTAQRVAAQRLHFRRVPAAYGRPEDDQRLLADVAAGIDVGETPLTRYLRARTAFVDGAVVDAVDGGMTQAILVGAGYDGRALRYGRHGLTWFEVDHPDTQADKRARLQRLGLASADVAFVPVDLARDDLGAALGRAGHDPTVTTLVVCEGVAPYLPPDVLTGALTTLAQRAAAGSTLVLELPLLARSEAAQASRARLNAAVTEQGEPLRSAVAADELEGMLGACGWSVSRATDPAGEPLATSARSTAFVLASPAPAAARAPVL